MKQAILFALMIAGCSSAESEPGASTELVAVVGCTSVADTTELCPSYGDTVVSCSKANGLTSPDEALCWGPLDAASDPSVFCCHRKPDVGASCTHSTAPANFCPAGYSDLSTCDYPTGSTGCKYPLVDQGTKRGWTWCCADK